MVWHWHLARETIASGTVVWKADNNQMREASGKMACVRKVMWQACALYIHDSLFGLYWTVITSVIHGYEPDLTQHMEALFCIYGHPENVTTNVAGKIVVMSPAPLLFSYSGWQHNCADMCFINDMSVRRQLTFNLYINRKWIITISFSSGNVLSVFNGLMCMRK